MSTTSLARVFLALFVILISSCWQNGDVGEYGQSSLQYNEELFAANADTPYKNIIPGCVYPLTINDICAFEKLPLLGREHADPTVDDVMDRLFVSHPWMADRFRTILEFMPADIRTCLSKAIMSS